MSQPEQKLTGRRAAYQRALDKSDFLSAYVLLKEVLVGTPQHRQTEVQDEMAQLCNFIAISAVKQEEFRQAEQFLRRALRYSRHSPYLMLVSYNNWSCLYKKTLNNSMALLTIGKAVALANYISEKEECLPVEKIKLLADSHINLCVVLSQMGEHQQALENANTALEWIEKYNGRVNGERLTVKSLNDRNNVMVIAKYNAAVELEHLKRTDEARGLYEDIRDFLGKWNVSHPMLRKVEKALKSMRQVKIRSTSRTSSARRRRFSTPKIEASTLSFETKQLQCSTLNMRVRKEPRQRLVLHERSVNTTALSTVNHSRSHTSDLKRPLSGLKILSHRRTTTKMHCLKDRLLVELD